VTIRSYDEWKSTNPADELLEHRDLCRTCGSPYVTEHTLPWCRDCWVDGATWVNDDEPPSGEDEL